MLCPAINNQCLRNPPFKSRFQTVRLGEIVGQSPVTKEDQMEEQLELFAYCYQCGEQHMQADTISQTCWHGKHGKRTTYTFCGETCRQYFNLGHMRQLEGQFDMI